MQRLWGVLGISDVAWPACGGSDRCRGLGIRGSALAAMEAEIQDFRCIRKLPCGLQFYAWASIQSLIVHGETGALGRQKLQLAAHRCPSKEPSLGSPAG